MKITEDVIRDLLPLYQAGEVSADTRDLVRAYLAEHPELAEKLGQCETWALPQVPYTVSSDAERLALRRTKRLLAWRSWVMAAAIFFTASPLSFAVGSRTGFRWLMWPDHAGTAAVSLSLGGIAWVIYAVLRRRLAPRGL